MGNVASPKPKRIRHATALQRVTLGQIAAACGLPLMTVSRAIRGKTKEVNAQDLRLAVETAERLGYRLNLMNRALRTGRRQLFGVLMPPLDAYLHDLLTGIHDASAADDVLCCVRLVAPCKDLALAYRAALLELSDRQVDGLVIVLPQDYGSLAIELQEICAERALPVVMIGALPASAASGAWVSIDQTAGVQALVARLKSEGVRQLSVVTSTDLSARNIPALGLLSVACTDAGILVVSHDFGRVPPGWRQLLAMVGCEPTTAVVTTVAMCTSSLAAALAQTPGRLPLVVVTAVSELPFQGWPLWLLEADPTACGRSAAMTLLDLTYHAGFATRISHVARLQVATRNGILNHL